MESAEASTSSKGSRGEPVSESRHVRTCLSRRGRHLRSLINIFFHFVRVLGKLFLQYAREPRPRWKISGRKIAEADLGVARVFLGHGRFEDSGGCFCFVRVWLLLMDVFMYVLNGMIDKFNISNML